MRASWTLRRVIEFSISLLFLGVGVDCLFEGHRRDQDFVRWQTAQPMNGAIDLSTPGRFVFPFEQTCSCSHGEAVALRVPTNILQGTTITQLLAGLSAKLEIAARAGSNLTASASARTGWDEDTQGGAIPVFDIVPFRKGAYKATITVMEGAPALKGISQQVEGRYLLCGLEQLPAVITSAVGVLSAVVGSAIGAAVLWRVKKSGKSRQV